MDTLLDRFVRYAKLDTQASEFGTSYPSTEKQLTLCRLLARGVRGSIAPEFKDVSMNATFGVVMATVPATVKHAAPAIAWFRPCRHVSGVQCGESQPDRSP